MWLYWRSQEHKTPHKLTRTLGSSGGGISGEWYWRAKSRYNAELKYSFVIICPMISNSWVAKGAEEAGLDRGHGHEREIFWDKWENDSALVCSNRVTSPSSAWKYASKEMAADSLSVPKYQRVWPSECSHIFKKILSHYSLNQPPTPLRFMFIFITPVRHKRSLTLKPILGQSCVSEWNVCCVSICSRFWWSKNQCAHTINQKGGE